MSYYVIPSRAPASGLGQPDGASNRAPYCSTQNNWKSLQTMLRDLGYYSGPIDGTMSTGGPTQRAAQAFAKAEGLNQYQAIDIAYCDRLIQRWNEKMAPAEGTTGGGSSSTTTGLTLDKAALRRLATRQRVQSTSTQPGSQSSPSQAAVASGSWWSRQSTLTKAAIVGGGVAAIGTVAFVASR